MEIHYLSVVGLLLIAVGWLVQFASMRNGSKEIKKLFPAVGAIGILLLIIDGYLGGSYDIAMANVVILASSLLVLARIK